MAKKPDYYYNQSGVIPFRINRRRIEILLVRSRKNKKWIIPKGIIESGMTPSRSAEKEAHEEAGAKGKIFRVLLGEYNYKKWGGTCRVKVFAMRVERVLEKWPEDYFRERRWFEFPKAVKNIKGEKLIAIMETLPQFIKGSLPAKK